MYQLSGIREIVDKYTHFVFDVWGVVHDGSQTYPEVIDVISFLHKAGKKICFLSNAPRRASKVSDVLNKFGVDSASYDFVLTSGEAAFLDLEKNQREGFRDFGKNYLYIGPQKDVDLLDGLNYKMVEEASGADFAIVTGFDHDASTLEEKLPQAMAAKESNLPMICVNPDMIVVKKTGQEMICAGALAKEYERMGGLVTYYGKPFPKVYESVIKNFVEEVDKTKILAIGDGLETDIKGANAAGIDSILVTGGILTRKLNIEYWQDADLNHVKNICDSMQSFPKFVISHLKL